MNKGKNIVVGSLQLVRWCKFNSFQPTKYIFYQKYLIYICNQEKNMKKCKAVKQVINSNSAQVICILHFL